MRVRNWMFLSLLLSVPYSPHVYAVGNVAQDALKGENLGRGGVARILQSDGNQVLNMMMGGTLKPVGNGLTSGGMVAEIDDTKSIKCERKNTINSTEFKVTGTAGGMSFYCNTPSLGSYYIYACPVSLVGEPCGAGSWYLVGGNRELPSVINGLTTGSVDTIENLKVKVVTCDANECSINVRYKRTTFLNAATMDSDGKDYLARRMRDTSSKEFALLGQTRAKQKAGNSAEQIESRYTSCLEQNLSKLGTGEKMNTCDQTEQINDPASCLQTTVCASIKPAPTSTKSCEIQVKYKNVEHISWSFPPDAYGQCTKLNEYKKHCLVSYQYVQRVETPEVEYVQQTAYGSDCPPIYDTDQNGNQVLVGYDSPCTITVERPYTSYHDYVATVTPNQCDYSGPGVSFDCGNSITDQQQWETVAFVTIMGRIPTQNELSGLDKVVENSQSNGKTLEEVVMDWSGRRPSIQTAFQNLIGRAPTSEESQVLNDAYSRWGSRAYSMIKTMDAFSGTLLYNYSKATGCFALDRKLNDTSLASRVYNFTVRGDLASVMELMAEYATN